MSYLDGIEAKDVKTVDDLISYTRDRFGVVVHYYDKNRFKGQWKEFQVDNPHVDISLLVKAVDWALSHRFKITSLTGVFIAVGKAFESGALPELDPQAASKTRFDDQVREALSIETSEFWFHRLSGSSGKALELALKEWKAERLPQLEGSR